MQNATLFRDLYKEYISLFWDHVFEVSRFTETLKGRKRLAENCSYLLWAKGLNHSLASYASLERGLLVDSALCARNAVESFLLLELLCKDESEQLFLKWSKGDEFKPSWVRKELEKKKEVYVRDVIISRGIEEDESDRFIYKWLSEITHANLSSLEYISRKVDENSFEIQVGGFVEGKRGFISTIFAVLCMSINRVLSICSGVFDVKYLEASSNKYKSMLEKAVNLSKIH
jgi:hypothetical protein